LRSEIVEEFFFDVQSENVYDFINGRVKILETYLLSEDTFNRLSSLPLEEFLREIELTHYRNFVIGKRIEDVHSGIIEKYDLELLEFEKYLSRGFINTFFRSKRVFLSIRNAVLGEEKIINGDLYRYVKDNHYPPEFKKSYENLLKFKNNIFVLNIVLSFHYINFLIDSARRSNIKYLVEYYETYAENFFIATSVRLLRLVQQGVISHADFSSSIEPAFAVLSKSDKVKRLKDLRDEEGIMKYLNSRKYLYVELDLSSFSLESLLLRNIKEVINRAKFQNTGIVPSFLYLQRLSLEVTELLNILQTKTKGIDNIDFSNVETAL